MNLKDISTEYKESKLNQRKINLLIPTGRVYFYKDNYYERIGSIKSRNSVTNKWEDHYRYVNILKKGTEYTRLKEDFDKKFQLINELFK